MSKIIGARSAPVCFSFNGWSTTRESSFGSCARSASYQRTFTHVSRHSSETLLTASGGSGGGASMFDKEAKTCMTRCDPAGHQLILLTSEFWDCMTGRTASSFGLLDCSALDVSHSTILSRLRESLGLKIFIYFGPRTSQRPVCNRFGWKHAESYCPFSRLTRRIQLKGL
jgi:hypothetical protein